MARGGGISGLAVFLATAGGFLIYIGIRNVPVQQGLREILKGEIPTPRAKRATPIPDYLQPSAAWKKADDGTLFQNVPATNSRIAEAAKKYLGTPYVWGGHTPQGFDCSGLVTWVLVKDLGLRNLPSQTHTVTGQFLTWSGAQDVPGGRPNTRAGDLICWPGHIGIAVSATEMVHAPTFFQPVQTSKIWWTPAPVVRRVKLSENVPGGSNPT